jgi:hypothetical protein
MAVVLRYLLQQRHLAQLHRFFRVSRQHSAAGLTSVSLFLRCGAGELDAADAHLANACMHFDDAIHALQAPRRDASVSASASAATRPPPPPLPLRFLRALTESELMQLRATASLQRRVVAVLCRPAPTSAAAAVVRRLRLTFTFRRGGVAEAATSSPGTFSLFGPRRRRGGGAGGGGANVAGSQQEAGAEAEAVQQRRSRIAEAALERDSFELAFRLIGDYRLAAEPIYTAAARRLARAQAKPALLRLLREVGATITDAERDEVVSQALEVWVREHGDVRAARALVAFIAAPAAKVAALLLVTLSLSLTHSLTHSLTLSHSPTRVSLQCGDARSAADVATGCDGSPAEAQAVLNALRGLPPSTHVHYASTVCEAFLTPYLA